MGGLCPLLRVSKCHGARVSSLLLVVHPCVWRQVLCLLLQDALSQSLFWEWVTLLFILSHWGEDSKALEISYIAMFQERKRRKEKLPIAKECPKIQVRGLLFCDLILKHDLSIFSWSLPLGLFLCEIVVTAFIFILIKDFLNLLLHYVLLLASKWIV